MKWILFLLCLTLLAGCGQRSELPEITHLHKFTPTKKEVVVIDAGHGGKDGGCMSKRDDYEEKELTLKTAFLVRNCLQQLGYRVVMTRTQDTYIPLDERAEIANTINANLFVSIHYNYSTNSNAKGVEVFYYKEKTKKPSKRILKSIDLGSEVLKKVISRTGTPSRGLKEANFAVVRETTMPAILVEAGFLSNPSERSRINDPNYQKLIAWGIATGVDQYLEASRR